MARKPAAPKSPPQPAAEEPAVEAPRKHEEKAPDPIGGADLEAIRLTTGWSAEEFASRIGLASEGEYWLYARDPNATGRRPPRLVPGHVQDLARALRDRPPTAI